MLLERDSELKELVALVDGLDVRGGQVALVRGEAGIGKTSLVAEFVARNSSNAHVLWGSCDDLLTPQTLGAFWDVARHEPSIKDLVYEEDRRRLQTKLLDLLSRPLRPTILVIEDTQWADEATLDVIRYVGRRIDRTNGVIVITYRDSEMDADHPMRQVIGDLPPSSVTRLLLQPLSIAAIESLIDRDDLDAAVVLMQTDGNPLYVIEVVSWGTSDVPASVQDLVVARASRVSIAARNLLELVAVVPGVTSVDLVEEVVGWDSEAFAECELAGLLHFTTGGIQFVHELQRRAMESVLSPDRRRELNALALSAFGPAADPAVLVHHARQAGDIEAIVEFAPLAARAAATAGSRREAVANFSILDPHLVRMTPTAAAEVLFDWAQQEFYLHNARALDLAGRSVDAFRRCDDRDALANALVFSARVKMQYLRTEEAVADAGEAVEILQTIGDDGALANALAVQAYVLWLYEEDVPAAIEVANRALAAAERSGDSQVIARALITKGNMEYSIGLTGGMQLLERAHSLASAIGDGEAEVRSLKSMTAMSADFRHMAQATDYARRAIDTASRHEMRYVEAETRAMYAELLLWQGDWSEVEDAATAALGAHPAAETIAWRVLGTLQARRGRKEARTALERMWEMAEHADQLTVVDPAAAALAEYMWLTGDLSDDWLVALDDILAEGTQVGRPWPSGALAFWMWKLDRIGQAPTGAFDMYSWIIRGELEEAIRFWGDRDIPYELALALMHGNVDHQLDALHIAEDLQADALAARIRAQLMEIGITPPRGKGRETREHAAGLTARQAEVLSLLSEHLSNAEIADRLFLSPRTVENHVAAILLKLDVPNRETAVNSARELGIL